MNARYGTCMSMQSPMSLNPSADIAADHLMLLANPDGPQNEWKLKLYVAIQGYVPLNEVPTLTTKEDTCDRDLSFSKRWKTVESFAWVPYEATLARSLTEAKRDMLPYIKDAVDALVGFVAKKKGLPFGPEDVADCWQKVLQAWIEQDLDEAGVKREQLKRQAKMKPLTPPVPKTEYFVYFKSKKQGSSAAQELASHGWTSSLDRSAANEKEWLLLVEGKGDQPEDSEIERLVAFVEPHGGDYDGWESG